MSVYLWLLIGAFLLTLAHAGGGKPPLWVPVLLVILALLVQVVR